MVARLVENNKVVKNKTRHENNDNRQRPPPCAAAVGSSVASVRALRFASGGGRRGRRVQTQTKNRLSLLTLSLSFSLPETAGAFCRPRPPPAPASSLGARTLMRLKLDEGDGTQGPVHAERGGTHAAGPPMFCLFRPPLLQTLTPLPTMKFAAVVAVVAVALAGAEVRTGR